MSRIKKLTHFRSLFLLVQTVCRSPLSALTIQEPAYHTRVHHPAVCRSPLVCTAYHARGKMHSQPLTGGDGAHIATIVSSDEKAPPSSSSASTASSTSSSSAHSMRKGDMASAESTAAARRRQQKRRTFMSPLLGNCWRIFQRGCEGAKRFICSDSDLRAGMAHRTRMHLSIYAHYAPDSDWVGSRLRVSRILVRKYIRWIGGRYLSTT